MIRITTGKPNPAQVAVVEAIERLFPDWEGVEQQRDWGNYFRLRLRVDQDLHEDEQRACWLNGASDRLWGYLDLRNYTSDLRVSVSLSRPVEAIAKDLHRRLLTPGLPSLTYFQARTQAQKRYRAAREANAARWRSLIDAEPGPSYDRDPAERIRYHRPEIYFTAQVRDDGRLELERTVIPFDRVEAVLLALAGQLTIAQEVSHG